MKLVQKMVVIWIMSFYYILLLINTFFKVRLYQIGGDAWFGVRLDLTSFILLLFVLLFSLAFRDTASS